MKEKVIVLGSGGHAKALIDALEKDKYSVLGLTDSDLSKKGSQVLGYDILGNDEEVFKSDSKKVLLINALGTTNVNNFRKDLYLRFKSAGFYFAKVIHPSATISSNAKVAEGAQVMAGAIIQVGAKIGENCIVNTGVIIDHDCEIGDHVHLSPGVVLSGGVSIGDNSHIGTGAVVIQGIKIGRNCLVAAGAVVVNDIPENSRVFGVPAKEK